MTRKALTVIVLVAGVATLALFYLYTGLFQYMDGDVGIYHAVPYQLLHGKYHAVDYGFMQGPGYALISFPPLLFTTSLVGSRLYFSLAAIGLVLWLLSYFRSRAIRILALLWLLTQLEFTQQLTNLGTKSALIYLLCAISVWSLVRFLQGGSRILLWIGFTLSALVALSKYSFLSLPVYLFCGVAVFSGAKSRWRNVVTAALAFSVTALGVMAPILIHQKVPELVINVRLLQQEFALANYTRMDGLRSLSVVALHLLINSLPVSFLSALNRQEITRFFRAGVRPDQVFLVALVTYFGLYFVSVYVFLFPVGSLQYGTTVAGLFVFGLMAILGEWPRQWHQRVVLLGLLCVPLYFNWRHETFARVAHWRLNWPDFQYSVLGRNPVVSILNGLKDAGHERYLVVGLFHAELAPSALTQSEYSVTGIGIDVVKPSREIANRQRYIAHSNFDDLLVRESVVALNWPYLRDLSFYEGRILQHELRLLAADEYYRVYVKAR
ncbi:MAG: hypothetical protein HYR96_10910 [Deltaproteobacteria bacterium]|nr:hypothetical protein [Deltaproteobacteria bacterium]MBI3294148.1 hypothetical protein [Deltaproteobacteria bacterium]